MFAFVILYTPAKKKKPLTLHNKKSSEKTNSKLALCQSRSSFHNHMGLLNNAISRKVQFFFSIWLIEQKRFLLDHNYMGLQNNAISRKLLIFFSIWLIQQKTFILDHNYMGLKNNAISRKQQFFFDMVYRTKNVISIYPFPSTKNTVPPG